MTGFTLGCASKNDQPRIKSRTSNAAGEGGRAAERVSEAVELVFLVFLEGSDRRCSTPRYDRNRRGSRLGWPQWQRRVLFRPDGTELRRGTDARVDPACS